MHMRSDNMKIVLTSKNALFCMRKKGTDLAVIMDFALRRVCAPDVVSIRQPARGLAAHV